MKENGNMRARFNTIWKELEGDKVKGRLGFGNLFGMVGKDENGNPLPMIVNVCKGTPKERNVKTLEVLGEDRRIRKVNELEVKAETPPDKAAQSLTIIENAMDLKEK